jgi:hypothetical protein
VKLPPEAEPSFWINAKCVRVRVRHFVSGTIERRFAVVSGSGAARDTRREKGPQDGPFSMQSYALALARVRRKKGATEAMRRVLPHVARVDEQIAALLSAAEQRAIDAFQRRKAADAARTNARRRERALEEIRRSADLLSEENVVRAWREGIVDGVHRL